MKTSFKVVPDTNVLLASEKHPGATSPNKEFVERWKCQEFELLYLNCCILKTRFLSIFMGRDVKRLTPV